jgi:hypothetical protein
MEMKYIRHSKIGFILWPRTDDLWHSHVAASIRHPKTGAVISAGFCKVREGAVACWGRSESLNIDSRTDDAEMLARQLGIFPSTLAATQPEPSCDDAKLAEMIMSDCGHSTENTRLLERITNRLACLRPAAQREPLTQQQIEDWWASNHGLEDCDLCRLQDFTKVIRAVEATHNITNKNHDKTNVC